VVIRAYRRRRYARRLAAEWTVQVVGMSDGERHFVYDLSRSIPMRPGVLYPTLARLEQKGLVRTGWEDRPVNPRRWYQLSDEGMRDVSVRVLGRRSYVDPDLERLRRELAAVLGGCPDGDVDLVMGVGALSRIRDKAGALLARCDELDAMHNGAQYATLRTAEVRAFLKPGAAE